MGERAESGDPELRLMKRDTADGGGDDLKIDREHGVGW
jgi:hypothetical protein